MTLRATVVIPTRNRADTLSLMLPHVLDQTIPREEFEVIVVDDDSTDDTRHVLAHFAGEGVVGERQAKAGTGAARNRALALATGQIAVFLDDDAFVRPDFLERHLAVHARDDEALVAGGIIEVREP